METLVFNPTGEPEQERLRHDFSLLKPIPLSYLALPHTQFSICLWLVSLKQAPIIKSFEFSYWSTLSRLKWKQLLGIIFHTTWPTDFGLHIGPKIILLIQGPLIRLVNRLGDIPRLVFTQWNQNGLSRAYCSSVWPK